MIEIPRKPALICAGGVLFYLVLAKLFLAIVPGPREPIQYMVAGAFATAITLGVAFVCYALGFIAPEKLLRTVRRSARPS
jgi:hypothetical protein